MSEDHSNPWSINLDNPIMEISSLNISDTAAPTPLELTVYLRQNPTFNASAANVACSFTYDDYSPPQFIRFIGDANAVWEAADKVVQFYNRKGWGGQYRRHFLAWTGFPSLLFMSEEAAQLFNRWRTEIPLARDFGRSGQVKSKVWAWYGYLDTRGRTITFNDLNGRGGKGTGSARRTKFSAGLQDKSQYESIVAALPPTAVQHKTQNDFFCQLTDMHDPFLKDYNVTVPLSGDGELLWAECKIRERLGKRMVLDVVDSMDGTKVQDSAMGMRIALSTEIKPRRVPDGLRDAV
ncbi:hypothetical protein HDV00_004142 [Rhizophlyctis rosea]|nr:hypothetical protein HDV00_004142 [Rhizophlyctis rosea]